MKKLQKKIKMQKISMEKPKSNRRRRTKRKMMAKISEKLESVLNNC